MPRNTVENQRRWRKKKKNDPEWRKREVIRVRSYYKATSELTETEKAARREKIRLAMRKLRSKKKQADAEATSLQNANTASQEPSLAELAKPTCSAPDSTVETHTRRKTKLSSPESAADPVTFTKPVYNLGKMTVKFSFITKTPNTNHAQKGTGHVVTCAKQKYEKQVTENDKFKKQVWRLEEKVQNLNKQALTRVSPEHDSGKATPVRKAETQLRKSATSPPGSPRKVLESEKSPGLHNVVSYELNNS